MNVASSDICPDLVCQESRNTLRLRGVNGASLGDSTVVEAPLTLEDGLEVTAQLCVVPGTKTILLGMPFLLDAEAMLDLRDGCARLYGRWYTLDLLGGSKIRVVQLEVSQQIDEICKKAALDQGYKLKLRQLLVAFQSLWTSTNLTQTSICKHGIEVTTKRPICCRSRRYTPDQAKIISEEVGKMLQDGIIRRSKSPYASGIVLVKKKTGEWRFCIDFRPLNEVTVRDQHPLPRIKDLLLAIQGSRYFVALDLRAGYWQIAMEEEDIPKTAFRSPEGLFEFVRMPFGLVNAPATFQRMMEVILGDLRWDGVLIYLDDVLIHAESPEIVLEKLAEVFKRLQQANLSLRLDKCEFFPKEIKYLGYLLGEGLIKPLEKKVQALDDFEVPRDVKGVRRLIGMTSYYRAFIPDFAKKVAPLNLMLKKGAQFSWGPDQEAAYRAVLKDLKEAVLHLPLEGDAFVLETDASDQAIGAILSIRRDGALYCKVSRSLEVIGRRE